GRTPVPAHSGQSASKRARSDDRMNSLLLGSESRSAAVSASTLSATTTGFGVLGRGMARLRGRARRITTYYPTSEHRAERAAERGASGPRRPPLLREELPQSEGPLHEPRREEDPRDEEDHDEHAVEQALGELGLVLGERRARRDAHELVAQEREDREDR